MNSVASQHCSLPESSSSSRLPSDPEFKRLFTSAASVLEQTPPPSLREILGAYRSKGDGDRDMLLAMLNAKAAEDQRLASVASLHRSLLESYQQNYEHPSTSRFVNGVYQYPTPSFSQSPRLCDQRSRRAPHHTVSRSRSPPRVQTSMRDSSSLPHYAEPPRKRHRSSNSPHPANAAAYEQTHSSQHEQFPPSPYSASDRSDSAEYSPRSRASMAIGSLLSSGPSREVNGDTTSQERE